MSELKNTSSQRLSKQNTSCRHQSGECERRTILRAEHRTWPLIFFKRIILLCLLCRVAEAEARVTQCNNIIKTPASGLKPNYWRNQNRDERHGVDRVELYLEEEKLITYIYTYLYVDNICPISYLFISCTLYTHFYVLWALN